MVANIDWRDLTQRIQMIRPALQSFSDIGQVQPAIVMPPGHALRRVAKDCFDHLASLAAIGEPRRNGAAEIVRRGRSITDEADAPASAPHGVRDGATFGNIENSRPPSRSPDGVGEQGGGLRRERQDLGASALGTPAHDASLVQAVAR